MKKEKKLTKTIDQHLVEAEKFVFSTRDQILQLEKEVPKVIDPGSQLKAFESRKVINSMIKILEDERKKRKQPFLEGGRDIDTKFNQPLKWLRGLKAEIEKANDAYLAKLEAARMKAEREARELAEAETLRLAKIAEEKGEVPDEITETQIVPAIPPVETKVELEDGAKGGSYKVLKFEISDEFAFLKGIVEGKLPMGLITISPRYREMENFLKDWEQHSGTTSLHNLPGLKVWEEFKMRNFGK